MPFALDTLFYLSRIYAEFILFRQNLEMICYVERIHELV